MNQGTKDISFPYLKLSSTIPEAGERIFVVGNPYGLESTVSDGLVSAVRNIPDIGQIIQISAPISSGSSGSPVINLNGQVVGIATFQLVKGQNLNFAISGIDIAKLSKLVGSVIPLNSLLLESKPYLSRINPEVQEKQNAWIKIINEIVIEQTPEEFYDELYSKPEYRYSESTNKIIEFEKKMGKTHKKLYIKVQFLKPCNASKIESGDPMKDFGEMLSANIDYLVPKFRCDYKLKVFVTYFSSNGYEIQTDGDFPVAWLIDDNHRKAEMLPGEKTVVMSFPPDNAESWYVWVPK